MAPTDPIVDAGNHHGQGQGQDHDAQTDAGLEALVLDGEAKIEVHGDFLKLGFRAQSAAQWAMRKLHATKLLSGKDMRP